MASLHVLVFLGSTREGRMGENVAKCVVNILEERGHEVELVDPLNTGDGHVHQPIHFRENPDEAPEWMKTLHASIMAANGFVLVTPEYNSTLPPAVTSVMNQFPPDSYRHKPCTIVSYAIGPFAGIRAVAAARPFLAELGMVSTPTPCLIPEIAGKFEDGVCTDEKTQANLDKVLSEFEWYTRALEDKKSSDGTPV